jgi:hypothetical protein
MTEEEAHALWTLRSKWLGIYQISLPRGLWQALRYGQRDVLTACTAEELDRKIQSDYGSLTAGRPT